MATDTTEPLPTERLARYAALEQAATEGPWDKTQTQSDTPVVYAPQMADVFVRVLFEADWGTDADAAFIAAARTAVPELLAEVARLTAERDELAHELDGVSLSLWEEEQANVRLRLAHRSARERAAAYLRRMAEMGGAL